MNVFIQFTREERRKERHKEKKQDERFLNGLREWIIHKKKKESEILFDFSQLIKGDNFYFSKP